MHVEQVIGRVVVRKREVREVDRIGRQGPHLCASLYNARRKQPVDVAKRVDLHVRIQTPVVNLAHRAYGFASVSVADLALIDLGTSGDEQNAARNENELKQMVCAHGDQCNRFNKKSPESDDPGLSLIHGGADGTRTRDPRRDRPVF